MLSEARRGHQISLELEAVVSYLIWMLGTKLRFSANNSQCS